jgi:hypothetical protein
MEYWFEIMANTKFIKSPINSPPWSDCILQSSYAYFPVESKLRASLLQHSPLSVRFHLVLFESSYKDQSNRNKANTLINVLYAVMSNEDLFLWYTRLIYSL